MQRRPNNSSSYQHWQRWDLLYVRLSSMCRILASCLLHFDPVVMLAAVSMNIVSKTVRTIADLASTLILPGCPGNMRLIIHRIRKLHGWIPACENSYGKFYSHGNFYSHAHLSLKWKVKDVSCRTCQWSGTQSRDSIPGSRDWHFSIPKSPDRKRILGLQSLVSDETAVAPEAFCGVFFMIVAPLFWLTTYNNNA